jgi:arginyl-tRNA synthetase
VVPDLPDEDGARAAFLGEAAVERLTDPANRPAAQAGGLPRMIEAAAVAMSHTESPFICMILASEFHGLWTGDAICPIYASLSIMMQNHKGAAGVVQGVVLVLASGLAILGVDAPAEMR